MHGQTKWLFLRAESSYSRYITLTSDEVKNYVQEGGEVLEVANFKSWRPPKTVTSSAAISAREDILVVNEDFDVLDAVGEKLWVFSRSGSERVVLTREEIDQFMNPGGQIRTFGRTGRIGGKLKTWRPPKTS